MDETARDRLLAILAHEGRETVNETGFVEFPPPVLAALGRVDRAQFVPDPVRGVAWDNRPQPLGHGQTISQPFIVALMTALLRVKPGARILEIGAGCGYQTAVLLELGAIVTGLELVPELAEAARARLDGLGYGGFEIRRRDGNLGCPDRAPFDGILVACAAETTPASLLDQLAPNGRLVIPLETDQRRRWSRPLQWLTEVGKDRGGRITERRVSPVAFVPFVKPRL